jgi:hypothetical protein
MMKLRQCGKTWESEENGHFSLNNGANNSWIRNSAISYEKQSLICTDSLVIGFRFMFYKWDQL